MNNQVHPIMPMRDAMAGFAPVQACHAPPTMAALCDAFGRYTYVDEAEAAVAAARACGASGTDAVRIAAAVMIPRMDDQLAKAEHVHQLPCYATKNDLRRISDLRQIIEHLQAIAGPGDSPSAAA